MEDGCDALGDLGGRNDGDSEDFVLGSELGEDGFVRSYEGRCWRLWSLVPDSLLRIDILRNDCIWLSLANAMSWGGHGCVGGNWMKEIRFWRMNESGGRKSCGPVSLGSGLAATKDCPRLPA